jgi:uncharacterized iron-regulated protein
MRIFIIFSISLIFSFSTTTAQDFDSDRLPIGDAHKKYNFCTVRLDRIFNTNTNSESSFAQLIHELGLKRIVMIGESHTNQHHHDVQLEVIKGLTEAGKPVVLVLEMFNPRQNAALAAWSSGLTDPDTFMQQTDYLTTWSHNYRYYKAIFDYAREKHLSMYGVNIERKYPSKIGRGGLGRLSKDELLALPEIDTSDIEHQFLIKVMMQGMNARIPNQFRHLYQAQSLWDAAMGEGTIKAAKKHPEAVVVLLAGSGHVVYNLGIGRIINDRSHLSLASVVSVDIPEAVKESGMLKVKKELSRVPEAAKPAIKMGQTDKSVQKETAMNADLKGMMMDNTPYRIVVGSYGDYLFGTKEIKREKYPSFGLSLKAVDGKGYQVRRVLPDTISHENGFRKGDIILSIDRKSFENLFEIKRYLQLRNWEDQISFDIQRGGEGKNITFKIKPIDNDPCSGLTQK